MLPIPRSAFALTATAEFLSLLNGGSRGLEVARLRIADE
ncbi:MAG: hypothetical protein ACI915_004097 [Gammaproteobacteria bacterium]|jgi:hypothetical protein